MRGSLRLRGLRALYRPLGWIRALLLGLAAIVPIIAKLPPDRVQQVPLALDAVRWCAAWFSVVVPTFVVCASALRYTRRRITDPEDHERLQGLLTHLHNQMFPDEPDERSRITLFRFERLQFRRWPWCPRRGGWLVAIKRSGDMHQDFDKARFQVGVDLTSTCGIAGKAWCDIADAVVIGLPDVHSRKPTKKDIDRYADLTHMSVESVKVRRPRSRSFYGMKIRAKNKKWGVVLVDSSEPQLHTDSIVQVFRSTEGVLSYYVTKV